MSGHSHSKTIKRTKEITDKKRGQMFSKLARVISVATREGGGNPDTNPKLRMAIETAKGFNMPKDNIERAIKKGTGELGGEKLEAVLVEAYGPGGAAIIIEGITDNKNRTLGEIKQILNQHQGKIADSGSVKWLFERKGAITIKSEEQTSQKNKEELELAAIEAGADDVYWYNNSLDVYTKPEELDKVKKGLEDKGIKIDSVSLDWVPKEEISLAEGDRAACQKLFEALDENDSVQEIYSNLKI